MDRTLFGIQLPPLKNMSDSLNDFPDRYKSYTITVIALCLTNSCTWNYYVTIRPLSHLFNPSHISVFRNKWPATACVHACIHANAGKCNHVMVHVLCCSVLFFMRSWVQNMPSELWPQNGCWLCLCKISKKSKRLSNNCAVNISR